MNYNNTISVGSRIPAAPDTSKHRPLLPVFIGDSAGAAGILFVFKEGER